MILHWLVFSLFRDSNGHLHQAGDVFLELLNFSLATTNCEVAFL
jgi:hypothetical protein